MLKNNYQRWKFVCLSSGNKTLLYILNLYEVFFCFVFSIEVEEKI